MNPRAFDLVLRSATTAALALGVLGLAAYEVVHVGKLDEGVVGFVGLVLGFYFGAHVSQNGASSRSRAEALAVEAVTGTKAPPDPYGKLRDKERPGG